MRLFGFRPFQRMPRLGLAGRLALLLVASLLPSLVLVWRTSEAGVEELVEAQRHRLLEVARAAAEAEVIVLRSIEAQFRSLAVVPAVQASSGDACRTVVRDAVGASPFLTGIAVATQDGWMDCMSGEAPTTFVGDRDYFRRALQEGGLVIGGVMRNRANGMRVTFVAQRVLGGPEAGRRPVGVLIGIVDLAAIPKLVAGTLTEAVGSEVLILDTEGNLVGREPTGAEANRLVALRDTVVGNPSGTALAVGLDGRKRLYAFAATRQFGATILIGTDLEELAANSNQRLLSTVAVQTLLLAGYLAFALLMARVFVLLPLRRLGEHAARIRAGDPSARVELRGLPAEMRSVGAQMNRMTNRLALRRGEHEQLTAELRATNAKLAALASRDALTGIANRREFDRRLESEWGRSLRGAEVLSVLLLDVDHFKSFNDRYGHLAGDECLRKVADVIASVPTRPSDLCARYGGEEFAVVLPGTDSRGAAAIGERILAALRDRAVLHEDGVDGIVTISIGVAACLPKPLLEPAALIAAADQALYAAKAEGRNRVRVAAGVDGAEAELVEFARQRRR